MTTLPDPMDISPKSNGGIFKQIIREGLSQEKPPNGSKVQVHYVGTLTDGTKFDSSRDRGEPFEFNLGKGEVIKAWDIGVASMCKGELAMLICKSEYAYGKQGSPPTIPPDATLRFEVEVLGWKGEDISPNKDGGIERYLMKTGEGYSTPNDGALVDVQYIGTYQGKQFEEREIVFNLGEGSDIGVCNGIEKALERFKKKETSRIILQPKYAFGDFGKPELNIPANAVVEYVVTLKSFEKQEESWSLNSKERVAQAQLFKDKGTTYFKKEKHELAIKMYKKILSFLESDTEKNDAEEEKKALILSANLNLSLCYIKLKLYFEAKDTATAAIKLDENNEKAYFRRGQAWLALGEAHFAEKDFHYVLKLEPNNKAAKAQLVLTQKLIREHLNKEKKLYANMFDKFAKVDTQKEEEKRKQLPDVMKTLGEWGEEERERAPTDFEKENPNILMLNGNGEFKDM